VDTSQRIRNTGGRSATAFSFQAKARSAIGINLTGHHMNAVSVDLLGDVGTVVRYRIPFDLDDDGYLQKIGGMVKEIMQKDRISEDVLLGVGVSVPGLISDDGEEVVYGRTLHFSGKRKEQICRYVPYRSRLFHDSYTAGYGESKANPELDEAFFISLGNSIGGAIISAKGLFQGETRRAGEIGHMIVAPKSKKKCYCGNYGCFDVMCNAGVLDSLTGGNLEEFFRLKEEKDPEALKTWERYLDHLALAVHNIRMLGDMKIVLGGYVGPYVTEEKEQLFWRVDKLDPFGQKAEDYIIPCRSKVESIAVGSARVFIDEFIDSVATME
jgi:predicted NBD/HSP70 family sugar kinase